VPGATRRTSRDRRRFARAVVADDTVALPFCTSEPTEEAQRAA
jgi:hypothetical protein